MPKTAQLTPRQRRGIEALLTARTTTEAAAAAGVSRRAMTTWLALPHFRAALALAQAQAIGGAVRKLGDVMGRSVDQLSTLIGDDEAAVKLSAIRIVMQSWPALRLSEDLERRLEALEAAQGGNHAKS